MKTPKYMTKAIKDRTITSEILGACTYSINKRAKNCRDKIKDYKHGYGCRKYIESYEVNKDAYYDMKDSFLDILKPVCTHKVHRSKSVYDGRTYIGKVKVICYYRYYKVGEYGFHRPIENDEFPTDLPIEDIGELITYGKSIDDLLSVPFCKKVLALIESEDYIYIP